MKAAVSPFPILDLTNVMPVARTLPEALRASAVTQTSIASRPDSLTTRPSSRKAGSAGEREDHHQARAQRDRQGAHARVRRLGLGRHEDERPRKARRGGWRMAE